MYTPLTDNTEETFLESLQRVRKDYLLKSDEQAKNSLEKLNGKMVYDDVKILNKDVKYIMGKLKQFCPYQNGITIPLECSEISNLEGFRIISTQYKKLKIDNQTFKKGFWQYFERAAIILATSLSEKTGIKFEKDTIVKPGITIIFKDKYYFLNIWWL